MYNKCTCMSTVTFVWYSFCVQECTCTFSVTELTSSFTLIYSNYSSLTLSLSIYLSLPSLPHSPSPSPIFPRRPQLEPSVLSSSSLHWPPNLSSLGRDPPQPDICHAPTSHSPHGPAAADGERMVRLC